MITRRAAAIELDVTPETVDTLVGQFRDDALYDPDADLITDAGMDLAPRDPEELTQCPPTPCPPSLTPWPMPRVPTPW
jgi:hypothetical protein